MKKIAINTALCVLLSASFAAQAALEDLGNGIIKDGDLGIEWLADANYANTSDYNTDGHMNWYAANTWAANLSYGGFDDWRLPTTSEMSHLFYRELDGAYGTSINSIHNNASYNLFSNIQAYPYRLDQQYWSSGSVDAKNALTFVFAGGHESARNKTDGYFGWAVRNVGVVPEPETYAMLLAGLGLVSFMARRRKQVS